MTISRCRFARHQYKVEKNVSLKSCSCLQRSCWLMKQNKTILPSSANKIINNLLEAISNCISCLPIHNCPKHENRLLISVPQGYFLPDIFAGYGHLWHKIDSGIFFSTNILLMRSNVCPKPKPCKGCILVKMITQTRWNPVGVKCTTVRNLWNHLPYLSRRD